MTDIPLGITSNQRRNSGLPDLLVVNRFYEMSSWNQQEKVTLVRRPRIRARITVPDSPIRQMKYQSGSMNNDLFVIGGKSLYRIHKSITVPDTITPIVGVIDGDAGDTPEVVVTSQYVFIADGHTLQWTDGVTALATVVTPDDVAISTIDYIDSFVMCGVANSDKFYWIEPGDHTIDPLNFATAERLPDWINNIRTIGDQVWMLGKKTAEIWYPTGDPIAPWQRATGRLFDQGVWQGSCVKVRDSVLVVGEDGNVLDIGASPQPVSTPGIAERVRKAMRTQEYAG